MTVHKIPEPVRAWIYTVTGAVLVALMLWGVIGENDSLVIAGIVQAVLMIPAAEAARAKVSPVRTQLRSSNATDTA
jgi:hypothetical protein